ncbi:MAG: HAD-IIIA family hydrolase [Pseudomonadota bacterium]
MTTPLSAVFFDLDGTLIDTRGDLHDCVNALRASYGMSPLTVNRTVEAVGHGIEHLVSGVLSTTDSAEIAEAVERFREHYLAHCTDKTEPYPGVGELLKALHERAIKVAVVTNKPQHHAERILEALQLPTDLVVGASPERLPKPDPAMLLEAARRLEADLHRSIYVGDMELDLEAARACDCAFVGVDFGFTSESSLPHRTAVCVDTVEALQRALLERA